MGSFYTLEYFAWISRSELRTFMYLYINFIQILNINNFIPNKFCP